MYFLLGEREDDYKIIERATRLCVRVIETGGKPYGEYWHAWGVGLMELYNMTDAKRYLEAAIDKFEQAVPLPVQRRRLVLHG